MNIRKATVSDIDNLMSCRIEMLKVVNELDEDFVFESEFLESTKSYFLESNQTTVLALDESKVVGCATICYIDIMPTFSHPSGKRAHVMNVYTKVEYRRQGIALEMMKLLIEDAKANKSTEISLDATVLGKPLYRKLGFVQSKENMVLLL